MQGARNLGYFYQLLAMTGGRVCRGFGRLPQPTLILMGSDDPWFLRSTAASWSFLFERASFG